MCFQSIRTVWYISRDDQSIIATCSLLTSIDRVKENCSIDYYGLCLIYRVVGSGQRSKVNRRDTIRYTNIMGSMYSGTCHERTPLGPDESVSKWQVVNRPPITHCPTTLGLCITTSYIKTECIVGPLQLVNLKSIYHNTTMCCTVDTHTHLFSKQVVCWLLAYFISDRAPEFHSVTMAALPVSIRAICVLPHYLGSERSTRCAPSSRRSTANPKHPLLRHCDAFRKKTFYMR